MYKQLDLQINGDANGQLISIQGSPQIPFDIKRIFYIYGTKSHVIRGAHANRHSQFVLIAVHGQCKVRIKTPRETCEIILNNPHTAVWLDKMVWKEMVDFSNDAVLLVLSDQLYDTQEYIRDYEAYIGEFQPC